MASSDVAPASAQPASRVGVARAVGIPVAISVAAGLLIAWFAWPATELAPRDLPVIVAGPPAVTTALTERLGTAAPGAFAVTTAPDAAAADAALREREAYAAFVASPTGLSLHTASGASPAVAGLLTQTAQQLAGPAGASVEVVDVAPGSAEDPRGAGFASGFLPLVLASMIAGMALALALPGKGARLVGLVGYAVLAGLVGAGVLAGLGIATGSYLMVAAALALLALAVSASIAGLAAVLGAPGIGLGVVVIFLLGNPISAIAAAPELLPTPWGAIGQLLPPGAGASLVRSVAFFDGAASAMPLWTLAGWALAGLVLLILGRAAPAELRRARAGG